MNEQASLPEIMEVPIRKIQTDTAIDSEKRFSSSYIAEFIKTMDNTNSDICWPILVNYRAGVYRLLSGLFFLDVYLYMAVDRAVCIVYRDLTELDEIRYASAAQMCKPTSSSRLKHFIYLYHGLGIGNGMGKHERRKEIGRIMCETPRQIQKYERIFLKGDKQLIHDVLHDRLGTNKAIEIIKANK
ncbi:hypothetical protein [Ethanoligenens harbinense]|uniref:Uncharacterized protein n=1 Tax=Ethanoligenens harbinense (strain DSM 18485 / JCM 12961 / CGMCC 1.5033 / YUAN-3) TaxID=663278 RepID=E6U5B6_ETHHY|nr:hypothetical protein [Ethanoligenens harbinense]ADU27929.1 hypothetical protein Ethha_2434 [Ethanoligenens harbinense YUAN-3]AVQ96958.1 hypothetical protein CXQ68_12510 [Ethanoligenens harbinense YUAN-3]AYF39618.1 hypothetical protein CXP51_12405 [Ethanoligenens harbinense]AYF42446.1 hypothetical protein CN246_12960 [Ethanoligenens harbinense]QCN93199.1 hypothetical protein DRA42_12555 [Ethanoligenens harbinense]